MTEDEVHLKMAEGPDENEAVEQPLSDVGEEGGDRDLSGDVALQRVDIRRYTCSNMGEGGRTQYNNKME